MKTRYCVAAIAALLAVCASSLSAQTMMHNGKMMHGHMMMMHNGKMMMMHHKSMMHGHMMMHHKTMMHDQMMKHKMMSH